MPSGAPRITDPLIAFDCKVIPAEKVDMHHIHLCEVRDLHLSRAGSPLIYANRAYGSPIRIQGAKSLAAARSGAPSRLTVACFHTVGPFVLPRLVRKLPGIGMRLVEGDQRRVKESLRSGESEVALTYANDLDEDFDAILLEELHPYVLLPDGHPLTLQSEVMPFDLAEEPMVLLDAPPSADYFLGLLRSGGVEPLVAYRSASLEMVRGMVGHGLGYTLLVTKPASDMTYDGVRLVTRPLVGDHEPGRIVIACRKGHVPSEPAQQFIAQCRAAFGQGADGR